MVRPCGTGGCFRFHALQESGRLEEADLASGLAGIVVYLDHELRPGLLLEVGSLQISGGKSDLKGLEVGLRSSWAATWVRKV